MESGQPAKIQTRRKATLPRSRTGSTTADVFLSQGFLTQVELFLTCAPTESKSAGSVGPAGGLSVQMAGQVSFLLVRRVADGEVQLDLLPDLAGHPAWLASIAVLRYAGVRVIDPRSGAVGWAIHRARRGGVRAHLGLFGVTRKDVASRLAVQKRSG
jgi:hypothetical protein